MTISGALQCPTETGATDQPVAIYQRQRAQSTRLMGNTSTQLDGSYELSSGALYANTIFQIRAGNRRARAVVKVAPIVTLNAPAPAGAQSAAGEQPRQRSRPMATFTGTVTPAIAGERVVLQITYAAPGAHWRRLAFGRVGVDGSYSIAHTLRTPGQASVRAVVHTGKSNVAAASQPVSYGVSQPQSQKLTIQTSAGSVSYGQPVTITGIAAGAASQPVKLLARVRGGAFAVVGESTTDARGAYSFTEQPLQNTYYRVTDATARSAKLFQAVNLTLVPASTPSTAQTGQQLTFSGTVTAAPQGQVVYLERGYRSGVGFHVVGVAVVNATSEYQIAYTFERAGVSTMRIKVPGDGEHRGFASAPFTVTVTG